MDSNGYVINLGSKGISGSVLQYLTLHTNSDLKQATSNQQSIYYHVHVMVYVVRLEVSITYRFSPGLVGRLSGLKAVWIVGGIAIEYQYSQSPFTCVHNTQQPPFFDYSVYYLQLATTRRPDANSVTNVQQDGRLFNTDYTIVK